MSRDSWTHHSSTGVASKPLALPVRITLLAAAMVVALGLTPIVIWPEWGTPLPHPATSERKQITKKLEATRIRAPRFKAQRTLTQRRDGFRDHDHTRRTNQRNARKRSTLLFDAFRKSS